MVAHQITKGISVTVETKFNERFSDSDKSKYIFEYQVTIENQTDFPIQLMRRHWYIFDSLAGYSEVEGEGVIGEQPVIYPGDSYTYQSFCELITDFGHMRGKYLIERKTDGFRFYVDIPEFELITPSRLN